MPSTSTATIQRQLLEAQVQHFNASQATLEARQADLLAEHAALLETHQEIQTLMQQVLITSIALAATLGLIFIIVSPLAFVVLLALTGVSAYLYPQITSTLEANMATELAVQEELIANTSQSLQNINGSYTHASYDLAIMIRNEKDYGLTEEDTSWNDTSIKVTASFADSRFTWFQSETDSPVEHAAATQPSSAVDSLYSLCIN